MFVPLAGTVESRRVHRDQRNSGQGLARDFDVAVEAHLHFPQRNDLPAPSRCCCTGMDHSSAAPNTPTGFLALHEPKGRCAGGG